MLPPFAGYRFLLIRSDVFPNALSLFDNFDETVAFPAARPSRVHLARSVRTYGRCVRPGFLHHKHEGDQTQKRQPHHPEIIDEGQHCGVPL